MSKPEPQTISPLPAGDYVFLCLLLAGPRSAYDIKREMERTVSHFWTAAHSQVYQQASRLVRDGYVAERATSDPRGKKLLSLTARGRKAIQAWLREPARIPRIYSETLVKLFFADAIDDVEATIEMLEDSKRKAQAELDELRVYEPILAARSEALPQYLVLQAGIGYFGSAVEWHDRAIAALRARAGR